MYACLDAHTSSTARSLILDPILLVVRMSGIAKAHHLILSTTRLPPTSFWCMRGGVGFCPLYSSPEHIHILMYLFLLRCYHFFLIFFFSYFFSLFFDFFHTLYRRPWTRRSPRGYPLVILCVELLDRVTAKPETAGKSRPRVMKLKGFTSKSLNCPCLTLVGGIFLMYGEFL